MDGGFTMLSLENELATYLISIVKVCYHPVVVVGL